MFIITEVTTMADSVRRFTKPSLEWLSNPEIFGVNRIKAHSDHTYFLEGKSPKQSLNGTWKFTYSENVNTRIADFYRKDFKIESLSDIIVPGHIQLQGYGQIQYVNCMYPWDGLEDILPPEIPEENNPVGGYVRDFVIDEELKDKRLFISFQGVETAFYLYINDKFVGYSEDSFTPAEFEITSYVSEGVNRIGVEVFQRSTGAWLEDQDFWRFSGIFRDVYLYAVPDIHIRDIFVHTNVSDDYASANITIDADLLVSGGCVHCKSSCDAGGCSAEAKVSTRERVESSRVDIILEDMSGNVVVDRKDMSPAEAFDGVYDVPSPKLWSAEVPYLYTLTIAIKEDGIELEKVVQKVGIRRFEIKDKLMLINGKRIEFNGVNRHEFSPYKGRAITEEEMLWDIKFLKQNNINAVRTCHYPDNTRWYELCDEYGIYLIDETNMETHGTWCGENVKKIIPKDLPEWCNIVIDRANSMVQRDKNHPSIVIWSCGNESFGGINIFMMSEHMRKLDNSRIVHYEGVFFDRRYNNTSDVESRMYAKPWDIEEYLNNNPEKPFISCEYSHAMGNSCGNISEYQDLLDKYPMYQGGFIWDYIDQFIFKEDIHGKTLTGYGGDFGDRPNDNNFSGDGIVFCDRTPSPKMQEVKFIYQQLNLYPDFGGVRIKNRRLFKGTDDVSLKVQLLRDGHVCFETVLDVDIPAGEEKYIDINIPMPAVDGEFIVQAYMILKEDCKYAKAGHVVASGRGEPRKTEAEPVAYAGGELKVVRGHSNVGVHGDGFVALFSSLEGSLISLKYDGDEFIERKPMPCYYRAATDNDRGCGFMYESGIWQHIGKWQRKKSMQVEEVDSAVKVTYIYELPKPYESYEVMVVYMVNADGSIVVEATYPGIDNAPELPLFGMEFVLRANQNKFKYYGLGPMENYNDRCKGAMYGIYSGDADENLTPYGLPQACGNRTGVRWLSVGDGDKNLEFKAVDNPFECTVLPYNETQLEEARHMVELPDSYYTFVKIMAGQMGVGGDDSWGAKVHDMYRIPADKQITLNFIINKAQ